MLMGRVASNPRIQLDLVANVERLLADERRLPYDQFERRLRNFERSADGERARRDAEAVRERRDASMRLRPDGSWRLTATFGSLDGAEVNEVFAHFIDAEWKSDLAASGDAPLSRCEAQRRADAVLAMARAAARAPGRGKAPLPTLDVCGRSSRRSGRGRVAPPATGSSPTPTATQSVEPWLAPLSSPTCSTPARSAARSTPRPLHHRRRGGRRG
ncbi:hypothetical protein YM304_10920 [Ilumatobacter coccineus YM16-304]|uniref:DUF222 domain-containing protein n=1 Tax=Ilumatobacter coccineus (strain NBRC 103263 / KCTC 29153 / YM16-304) TaxID=1313172 RepID=A0A6C7EBL5_ILUCY|nr:hypothetical protein YM304_10920 [Ilumatobacter coccineus YM16-304]